MPDMHPSHVALMAALGAGLLVLGSLAAVGGKRTVVLARGLGWGGVLLSLFIGAAFESLSKPIVESPSYAIAFLPPRILRVQALAMDPDLRTRYNLDPRLRYLPPRGERIVDLEAAYITRSGLRDVAQAPVRHTTVEHRPEGMTAGSAEEVEQEVEGLYEMAWRSVSHEGFEPAEERLGYVSATSVGFLVLGLVGLGAGCIPLIGRAFLLVYDVLRLGRGTSHHSYESVRTRAFLTGARGLWDWHAERARPHVSLAVFGLLTFLGGFLMGLLREEETRSLAYEVFSAARYARIEGARH